ncbi:hypothetical protein ACIBL3_45945 [Kribbella sp. NPDC050124]|uniref:hypothetical protein n=1 Tax=Kribbella sp. NPDC050124 TaxID=3364114 RepID=UPI0037A737C5
MAQGSTSSRSRTASLEYDAPDPAAGWLDIAVLVEHELSAMSAQRLLDMYPMRKATLRYNLVRAATDGQAEAANAMIGESLDRLDALGAHGTGTVSEQTAVDALRQVIEETQSEEVVVVSRRHRLNSLLRRDLASQARARIDLPMVHLVER